MAELPPRQNPLDRPEGYSAIKPKKQQQQQAAPTNFIGKVATSGPGKILLSGLAKLEPLMVPKNIVQSTLKEVSDLASGKGFSTQDWNKQRAHGTGPIFKTGNKWVDRLGGLTVDVGLDPLMFLHLGKVHSISALERAASGARFVAAGGDVAKGAKIAQRGSYFLTDAERALAGYSKAGVYFMGARIAGTAKVGRAGEQTFAGLRMLMGRGKLGEMAKAAFSPEQVKAARTALRLGKFPNDEAAAHALAVMNSPAKGRAVEKINVDLTRQEFDGIRNQQGEALKNFDGTVHRVLENPELVVSPQEQGLANVLRNQLKSMHERLAAAGEQLYATFKLGEIQNYFPHVPTREGFKEIRTNAKLTKILKITDNDWKTPGSFLPRQLKKDETFFDYVLKETDLTVERLNQIARDGGFKGDFFETSVTKVLDTYAGNYSKQMGKFAQFDYLKKTGAVDYITSAFAPSNAAIKIGKDRFNAAATSVKERENAVSAVNAQISELTARNIDAEIANTVGEIGRIDARAAGDALLLKKVEEARAALVKENEHFSGLFDVDGSPRDAELLQLYDVRAQLGQKLQAVQDDLDQMAELIGNSMNESHVATAELGARENFLKTLEDLNAGLETKSAELNSFIDTATAGKELFDAHLINILNGETLINVPEELRQAVRDIKTGQKTVGAQTKALTKKETAALNAERKKNNMLSIWWQGITKEFPLSQTRVTNMTTVEMQARMAVAAQGHSTLIDLQTTSAALLHRIDMSYTMTSAEGVATKLAMPKEIQSLYDQLVVEMEKTYKIKKNLNKHLTARQRTNLTNKTARKQSVIEAMEIGLYGEKDSVAVYSKRIEEIDIQLDRFNQSGGVKNRKQQLLSSKETNQEYYNQLLSEKKDLLDKIDEIETRRFHFGSGAAEEVFSIRGGNTLPSSKSTRHLLAKTKGNNPRAVGSLEDLKASLEENIVKLAYKEEGTVGSTNAKLKEMGLYVQVTKEQARKQSEVIERLFVISETFRRATQVQDVLLEKGIVMDEKAFNYIFSYIVGQRHAVWNGRKATIEAANEQFGSLVASFNAAVEAGTDESWKAFANVRKTLLESSDTDLTKVVGRGASVNTQNEGQVFLKEFEDIQSVRQQASRRNRPTEAYGRLAGAEAGEKVAPTNARAFEETAANYDVMISGPGGDQAVLTSTRELRLRYEQANKDLVEWYNDVAGKLPGQKVGETGKLSPIKIQKPQLDAIKKLLSKGSYYTELPTQQTAQNLINILGDALKSEKELASKMSRFFTDALDTQASARGVMRGEAQDTPLSHSWFMQSYAEKMDALMMGKEGRPVITANNADLEPKRADYEDTVDGWIAYKNDRNDWITNPETSTSRDIGALELKERVKSAPSRTVDAENRADQLLIELEASRGNKPLKKGEKRIPEGLDQKVIKERQAANRALRKFESNPEYDMAVAAAKKKEALAKYADYSLDDVNQVIQEANFPVNPFSPEEWDSMFIGQVSIRKIKIVKDELAVLDEEIRALQIKKAGYKQAARQSQIEEQIAVKLNFRTERARMLESMQKIYSNEKIKSSASDKFAKTLEILKETEQIATPVLSKRRVIKPNSSKVQTEQRLQSLEFNWSQSAEKRLLDEHAILWNNTPATNTRGLAERYASARKEILDIATQKEKDLTNIATKTEQAQSLFQDVTNRIDESAVAGTGGMPKAGASIPSTPEDLQDAALGLSRAANRINTIEDQRLASVVTNNSLSEEVKLARQELRRVKKSLNNNPQAIAAAKERVAEATAKVELAKKQGERLLKGAQMLDDIKNGKLEKISVNGKDLRGSLEKNLESVEKKIRLKTEANAKPVDKAQKRLDEAIETYGPNFADSYYAQYDQFANKPILEEKLLVLKELKTGLGPRNAETKAQVDKLIKDIEELITTTGRTDSSDAGAMLLRSLETQRIGAEYHLAFSKGNLFREEATLKAIKEGVGGDMVGVLKEGWVRLGYPPDEEMEALKQLTDKQRKALGVMKPKKTTSNDRMADLGLPGLQAPQDVVDSFQSVLRNFSTKQGTNDVFDFLGGYTRFFKAYATLTPGFHVRNAMSNGFAMLSADANIKNLKDGLVLWKRYRDNPKTWLEGLSPKQARDAQAALEASFSTGSGRTKDMLAGVGQGKLTDNRALRFSQRVGERVEGSSRFMLSYDGIIKGMDSGQAGARVTKYLFDYSNPSMIDEKLRNIVPFWTWMSRNLPLQLVNRWTNPRAYVAYENFVKSVSQDSSNDAVPQYMREAGAFKIANGLFLQPDLGFNRVQQTVTEAGDPTRLLSYVNPALRLIPELAGNRKYYNNQPFSQKPQELKGVNALLAPFLQMAGMTSTGANGSQYVPDKTQYAIRNLLPTFAQGERLFPSTEGGNQKRASSWATWMGLPIKELTPAMEKSENLRRKQLDSDIRARRKNLGY